MGTTKSDDTKKSKKTWKKGYISDETVLHEFDVAGCDKSKLHVYKHPKNSKK